MSKLLDRNSPAAALACYAATALAIAVTWWWLGAAVHVPPLPGAGKLYCVSYAPFRGSQDPLIETTHVDAAQIDEDLALLARYTGCVRTYSTENGLDQVPGIAQRYGLKVLQGLWLSNNAAKNRNQIETAVALARQFPDVIQAVTVGNEVLLRGDMAVNDLAAIIGEVKSRVSVPVTYADVWEFWLRYRDLQAAVDFVTIHILPYWEDVPLPASLAAAHVESIRKQLADAMPGKEIVVGEIGWPSAGRMREGAEPSPSNQARVIVETVAAAQRGNFRVNVIEAFDQPWKRWLEGPTGGYWGIFDRATQAPKFGFDGVVSDHPLWLLQAAAGIALAGCMFGAAWLTVRGKSGPSRPWATVIALAFPAAVLFGWTLETIPVDSFSLGGWLRCLAFAVTAAATPIACAAAIAAGRGTPTFAALLGRSGEPCDRLTLALGAGLIALTLLSLQSALGLVFDPRYRDLPFAPQSGAVLGFLILMATAPRCGGARAAAETLAAAVLALAAVYILINETLANWQAVWLCGGFLALAFTLARARAAPG